jgi:phenylalanine ammonia-lyase
VEAMKGYREAFTPYLHDVARPHPGQIKVAANIHDVLLTSSLARPEHMEHDPEMRLRQDRYCLRAVPQWLGPQLEDLDSAQRSVEIEINSTTDNPIVDVDSEALLHGANFMATVITSVSIIRYRTLLFSLQT